MPASRKTYTAIAAGFRAAVDEIDNRDPEPGMPEPRISAGEVALAARLVAHNLKEENSSFRYDYFFEACGLDAYGYPRP